MFLLILWLRVLKLLLWVGFIFFENGSEKDGCEVKMINYIVSSELYHIPEESKKVIRNLQSACLVL